jgi:hypothetical protein
VNEIFAESNVPNDEDTVHQRMRLEAETGKIWQEGCGDPNSTNQGRIYIDLAGWESHHETWEQANHEWIAEWRGRESGLRRAPAPSMRYPLAPTERCTPGEIPTSTPSPSPTPTPSATPEATPIPTPPPATPSGGPGTPGPTSSPTPEGAQDGRNGG